MGVGENNRLDTGKLIINISLNLCGPLIKVARQNK